MICTRAIRLSALLLKPFLPPPHSFLFPLHFLRPRCTGYMARRDQQPDSRTLHVEKDWETNTKKIKEERGKEKDWEKKCNSTVYGRTPARYIRRGLRVHAPKRGNPPYVHSSFYFPFLFIPRYCDLSFTLFLLHFDFWPFCLLFFLVFPSFSLSLFFFFSHTLAIFVTLSPVSLCIRHTCPLCTCVL